MLRTIGVPVPVPDMILGAGLRPNEPSTSMDPVQSSVVWDALLCVEGGLPDDVLLGIPETVVLARSRWVCRLLLDISVHVS